MTHTEFLYNQFISNEFKLLAEKGNSLFFEAYGELCCEINGVPFNCHSVEEFDELVEMFGDDTFEE